MEIKAPKTINDLRIKHLKALQNESFYDLDLDLTFEQKLDLKISFVAGICSITKEKAYTININDIDRIYNHCLSIFDNVDIKSDPPKEIIIKGKCYTQVNPERVSTGWHADWSASDIEKDPVRIACLMYIPKGSNYSELDETGNLKDRIADRYDDFKEDFQLVTFMQASAFFLRRYYRFQNKLMVQKKTQETLNKYMSRMFGKMRSTKLVNTTV